MSFRNVNTKDTLKWKYLENIIFETMCYKDFKLVRLSLFQDRKILTSCLHDVFVESHVSDNQQDMIIHVENNADYSLRPEGTINVLNNFIKTDKTEDIKKYYYLENMYRISGQDVNESFRLGAEIYGDNTIVSDILVIETGLNILKAFGFHDCYVNVGSYGCNGCTVNDESELLIDKIDEASSDYSVINPELLEIKRKIASTKVSHSLCPHCHARLNQVKHFLSNLMIDHKIDYSLKRTFNYYNGTVFNFYVRNGEEDILVGGGGRYDQLTTHVVDKNIPSIGFDLDLERLFKMIEKRNLFPISNDPFKVYICSEKEGLLLNELQIHQELQRIKVYTLQGVINDDMDNAIEKAELLGCSVLVYLAEESLYKGKVEIKNIPKEYRYQVALESIVDEIDVIKKSSYQVNN